MKLLTKFNIILLVLFSAGGLILSQAIYSFLVRNAQREALQQAELMMASAKSVREYTSSDLAPLLEQNPQHKQRFLPETVPAFGALSTFNKLRANYPDYTYREPALNPTNPEHRATAWKPSASSPICATIRIKSASLANARLRWARLSILPSRSPPPSLAWSVTAIHLPRPRR